MWVQSVDNTALDISNNVFVPTDIGETFQVHFELCAELTWW